MAEEIRTLTVQKLATGGDGIAFSDGQVVFIPFTIPGEKVSCRIVESSHDYLKAELLEVLEPSGHRVEPECPLFGICGGCNLQHIDIEKQRELKAQAVREAFMRTAKFDPGPLTMRAGTAYGYRNRAEFHFTSDHGIGFMVDQTENAIRASDCPVVVPVVRSWLRTQNRKSRPERDFKATCGNRDRFTVFGQDSRLYIEGRDANAHAVVAGRDYVFPVKHFFQSNVEVASMLVQDVIEGVKGRRAVDLYAGSGLFAKRFAEQCDEVICVESDPVALEAARQNLSGPGRAVFRPVSAEAWIKATRNAVGDPKHAEPIDWVTVDPPRSGLSHELRIWLASSPIGAINYVSCDHVTMARDLRDLMDAGWQVVFLRLYDFYPQTGRIEAFARLVPGNAH